MKIDNEFTYLDNLFDELFPICRSITGNGLRQSLEIIKREMPLVIESVPTGTKVHDWTVPQEWDIRSASLTGPDGKIYADFSKSNLHVLNYSAPIDEEISYEDLQPHLHSIESLPNAVPYVTSYYKRNWGFCVTDEVRKKMPKGKYRARIDSDFKDGELNYGHHLLKGDSQQEFLLSSYLCHPSLANNELSGPLVLLGLFHRISKWKKRRYSYRFALVPETIGSICFLSKHGEHLKNKLAGGLVLTCLGGNNTSLSYKTSRRANSLIDRVVLSQKTEGHAKFRERPFTPIGGSDERQYCSAGYNLPVGQIARDVYGDYDGYHNSLDTKEFMSIAKIVDSIDQIEKILLRFEYAGYFANQSPYGEPQLGKRGLYPNLNSHSTRAHSTDSSLDGRDFLNAVLFALNYSDGENAMLDIAAKAGFDVDNMKTVVDRLEEEGLLKLKGANI